MKFVVYLFSFLLVPGWLFAGDLDNSLEVTIYSGASFAKDTLEIVGPCEPIFGSGCVPAVLEMRNRVGNSFLFGMGVGYYINRHFEVEGNFSIAPAHQMTFRSNFPLPYSLPFEEENVITYNYDVNVVYNLDWKGIRPYLTAGIGGITRDHSHVVETDFTYNFGVGTKFYYKDIGFRLELNDHIITDYFQLGTRVHNVQIQPGIFFKF